MLSPIPKRLVVRDELMDEGRGIGRDPDRGGCGRGRPKGSKNRPKAERLAETK